MDSNRILILDFGSQFTQLIARRIREERVYCEIHPPTVSLEWIAGWQPKGIVLSGGPNSVYGEDVPTAEPGLVELGIPILGICYGMQLLAQMHGGSVINGRREYGRAELEITDADDLFFGFPTGDRTIVWASHGDHVNEPPPGYRRLARTETLPVAAFQREGQPIYGVQFHPEVAHTPRGAELIANFLKPQRQRLSRSLLEVLAVVAYRQPLTMAEIETVRGVQSDYSVRALLERRLIREVGRRHSPGRPLLFHRSHPPRSTGATRYQVACFQLLASIFTFFTALRLLLRF